MIVLVVLTVVACQGGAEPPPSAASELAITLVGNAGFVLSLGETSVGIDALFTYQIPAEAQRRMEQADQPFDLDVILVTHDHSDHVHARIVARNLTAHPGARLIAPASVIASVLAITPDLERHRLIVVDFSGEIPFVWETEGLRVEAFPFPHPPNGQPPNAGYRLRFGAFTLYHTGDLDVETAGSEFARFGFPDYPVDLAFVPYFQLSPPYAAALENLPARVLVPMHLRAGTWAETCEGMADAYDNLLCFEGPMEPRFLSIP